MVYCSGTPQHLARRSRGSNQQPSCFQTGSCLLRYCRPSYYFRNLFQLYGFHLNGYSVHIHDNCFEKNNNVILEMSCNLCKCKNLFCFCFHRSPLQRAQRLPGVEALCAVAPPPEDCPHSERRQPGQPDGHGQVLQRVAHRG